MRHDKAELLMRLALHLSDTRYGRTLDEMVEHLGVGRRTVERMRDALRRVLEVTHPDKSIPDWRRRFILKRLPAFLLFPQATELHELDLAIQSLRLAQQPERAAHLQSLRDRLTHALAPGQKSKIETDAQALSESEAVIPTGPGPRSDPLLLDEIRHAVLSLKKIRFTYRPRRDVSQRITVTPLGLLVGRRTQLIAIADGAAEPSQFRVDRLFKLVRLPDAAAHLDGFDIQDYAARSFGVGQDETEDIVLRFNAKAAADVRNWRFHASQAMSDLPDGGVEVRMRCAGMLELAWHLFSWGPNMEIVAPQRLRRIMRGELVRALDRHAPGSVKASAKASFAPDGTTWESYGGGTGQP
ncbi:MAG: WYL domain-containing protein [Micropepsaceae bacterium]